ncbi:MAG: alpha-mannosidase [Clostridia bacterium]|nr:alpha-mannosidase [Clostridia bacterium]
MAKKLHLVCNAHLDPVWQWEWEEGAAEALSTFRIAASFCEEYDNLVFCHNEALLYKWIEEYNMPLFEHIKDLVKRGKWHIMGGWHLQPDCNMPSGEGFVRQILSGRRYFKEKFGVVPKVAVNLDPFGHTRGLVQIIKKSGYEGYLFMRPTPSWDGKQINLPANDFKWVGYDGSEVTAVRIKPGYNNLKGKAKYKIEDFINACNEDDFLLCLWGVGNHGGGPSKKDLDDIETMTKEMAEKDISLIHSTPEAYFEEVNNKRDLPKYSESINLWGPGCYTSQVRIKQRYRLAENTCFLTEIMCSQAANAGLIEYPEKEFAEAIYDILTVQFHDILPGTSIQPAEEMALRMLDHALEILSRIKARAFFALAASEKKAPEDKIPVFAYNPYPYPVKGDFSCEFMLWDQVWEDVFEKPVLFDEKGEKIAVQCEKEHSNLALQWRKRIVFNATLKPMALTRFECAFERIAEKPKAEIKSDNNYFYFESERLKVNINRKTGLVDLYSDGKENYVQENAFALEIFKDDADPWFMNGDGWKEKCGKFKLLSNEEATKLCCVKEEIEAVRVIESGSVRTVVEALFGYNSSRAIVKYIMSEQDGLKIDVRLVWSEKQETVKMNIPASFKTTSCIGEHAYGREELKRGMTENVSQKYIMLSSSEKAILAVNNGIYGLSFDDKNNSLKITLLRSPAYTAHPIEKRDLVPQDRYMPYIEQGERDYSFRFEIGNTSKISEKAGRIAQEFNMQPYLLSFYPTGAGKKADFALSLSDDIITINAFKKADNGEGYIIRLFNPTEKEQTTKLCAGKTQSSLSFGKYEIKTLRFANGILTETDLMEDLI